MDNRDKNDQPEAGTGELRYETPAIVDHGSLAELTLASTGSYTDGAGLGGGGS